MHTLFFCFLSPSSLLIHTTLCLAPSPRRLVYSSCQQVYELQFFFLFASAAYPHRSIHFVLNRIPSAAFPRKCQFIFSSLPLALSLSLSHRGMFLASRSHPDEACLVAAKSSKVPAFSPPTFLIQPNMLSSKIWLCKCISPHDPPII